MDPRSLTIVLPAYNEAERIGPGLDELFGYLRRRGEQARDGAPGSSQLPVDIRVLVVDDGSTDETIEIVRARPEAATDGPGGVPLLSLIGVPHGGKGAAVRAGMLAVTTDLGLFSDADMATPPDQIPLLVAALLRQIPRNRGPLVALGALVVNFVGPQNGLRARFPRPFAPEIGLVRGLVIKKAANNFKHKFEAYPIMPSSTGLVLPVTMKREP